MKTNIKITGLLISMLFTIAASSLSAEDDSCCNGGAPLPDGKKCCYGTMYDEDAYSPTTISVDFGAIKDIVSGKFDAEPNGTWSGAGGTSINFTKETKDLCCSQSVVHKTKFTGTGSLSLGSGSYKIDLPYSIPYVLD